MQIFYAKVTPFELLPKKLKKRGYNKRISVYKQTPRKTFEPVGDMYVNTASHRGDEAAINQILHDVYGFRWAEGWGITHYRLKRSDIKIVLLPNV